jgi:hypothetical protein
MLTAALGLLLLTVMQVVIVAMMHYGNVKPQWGRTYWWMDAGWYPCGGQWQNVGTWEPDRERFPKGLREISDYARSKGILSILWFEPERVYRDCVGRQ